MGIWHDRFQVLDSEKGPSANRSDRSDSSGVLAERSPNVCASRRVPGQARDRSAGGAAADRSRPWDKIIRQRERVNGTLTGVDPAVHIAQIQCLNAGLRLILKKLAPRPPEPPKPPHPTWDDEAKTWVVLSKADRDAYASWRSSSSNSGRQLSDAAIRVQGDLTWISDRTRRSRAREWAEFTDIHEGISERERSSTLSGPRSSN